GVTRNGFALSTLPAGFVMPIDPPVASSGTLARIRLDSTRVKLALTPLNVTSVALPTAWPSIVTSVPVGAAAGVNALIVGGRMTSNTLGLDAVPAPVLPAMRLGGASDGTGVA